MFKPGQEETVDLAARVGRLERTVEEGFDRILGMLQTRAPRSERPQNHATSSPAATSRFQHTLHPTPRTRGFSHHLGAGMPSIGEPPLAPVTDGSEADEEANAGGELNALGNFHASGSTVAMRIDSLLSDVGDTSGCRIVSSKDGPRTQTTLIAMPMRTGPESIDRNEIDLDSRLIEFGLSNISATFTSNLPPRDTCEELIEHFFRDINWIRHPIPEKLVRPQLEQYLAAGWDGNHAPLSVSNINVFANLSLVISMATFSTDSEAFPGDLGTRRLAARKFEFMGRRSLLMGQVIGREDVMQVVGFTLAWRFLMLDRRMNEAWRCSTHAVAAGYAIGLHRDGSKLGLPQLDVELRRGLWAQIVFADLLLAGTLGRPPIADPDRAYSDNQTPSLEGIKHWWPYQDPVSHPKATKGVPMPTIYQHMMQRESVYTVACRKIVEIYQKLTPHHYSDVLAADAELLRMPDELPHYYRVSIDDEGSVECDRSLDADIPFLRIHRFFIHSDLHFARISLHRSYLLRSGAKGSSGQRFLPSRKACVDSAMKDLAMRADLVQRLRDQHGHDNIPRLYCAHMGQFTWFNSLLIACIAALLDPHMPEIPTLRSHLDRFMKTHELKKQGRLSGDLEGKDDVREREVTIIAMFVQAIDRARQAVERAQTTRQNHRYTKDEDIQCRKRGRAEEVGVESGRSAHVRSRERSRSSHGGASREETTADVLLDLGKGHFGVGLRPGPTASLKDGHKDTHHQHSSASSGRILSAVARNSSPCDSFGGYTPQVSTAQHQLDLASSSTTSPAYDGRSADSSTLSTSNEPGATAPTSRQLFSSASSPAVDSPQGLAVSSAGGAMGPDGRSSRLVDSAQADFNAWFQMEFAGGAWPPLPKSSANEAASSNLGLLGGNGGAMAGVGSGFVAPGQGIVRGPTTEDWAVQSVFSPCGGGAPGLASLTPSHVSGGRAGPATSIQWTTLPRPAWDSQGTPSRMGQASSSLPVTSGQAMSSVSFRCSSGSGQAMRTTEAPMGPNGPASYSLVSSGAVPSQQQPLWLAQQSQDQQDGFAQQQQTGQQDSAAIGGDGGLGNSFDPGFWADLINKISS